MATRTLVIGKGFTPTEADVRSLLSAGHIAKDARVKSIPGKEWASESEGITFAQALLVDGGPQLHMSPKSEIKPIKHSEKEYLVISEKIIEETKPWWQFWG